MFCLFLAIFQSYFYLFSRRDGKEHVKTNYSHVRQIQNKIQPVPYLPRYIL